MFNNTNCGNWHSKKEYKDSIFKFIGIHINSCFMVLKNGCFGDYKKHYLNIFQSFNEWNLDSAPPGTYLESYYQYYPPLEKYENIIREKLLLGLEPYRNDLKEKYDADIFLHTWNLSEVNYAKVINFLDRGWGRVIYSAIYTFLAIAIILKYGNQIF